MNNTNTQLPKKSDRLLDLKQACKKTCMSKTRIYELLKSGKFPAKIKFGRTTRFSENEINDWIEQAKSQRKPLEDVYE